MVLLTSKISFLRFTASKHKDLRDICLLLSFIYIYVPQRPLLVWLVWHAERWNCRESSVPGGWKAHCSNFLFHSTYQMCLVPSSHCLTSKKQGLIFGAQLVRNHVMLDFLLRLMGLTLFSAISLLVMINKYHSILKEVFLNVASKQTPTDYRVIRTKRSIQ